MMMGVVKLLEVLYFPQGPSGVHVSSLELGCSQQFYLKYMEFLKLEKQKAPSDQMPGCSQHSPKRKGSSEKEGGIQRRQRESRGGRGVERNFSPVSWGLLVSRGKALMSTGSCGLKWGKGSGSGTTVTKKKITRIVKTMVQLRVACEAGQRSDQLLLCQVITVLQLYSTREAIRMFSWKTLSHLRVHNLKILEFSISVVLI